ncbi:MAG: NAD-dependent epimerase/dehydratase family protein, partial [Bacteriovoracaceae bacterium]|nr:NAD-dependent epimerase/dehydratase family protein [Bacteriovoracaceae bacterium]
MKILVTGGGGFLGTAILKILKNYPYELYSFSRNTYPHLETMGVKNLTGDLSDYQSVKKALTGMDAVFHVAAKAGVWGDYEDYFNANFMGTKNIVDACLELKIKKCVYTSSPSTILDQPNLNGVDESLDYPTRFSCAYAETKALAEKYLLSHAHPTDFLVVALRPHLIWGPGDPHIFPRLFSKASEGKLKIVGNGRNLVDVTYVDNAANAHVQAFHHLAPGSKVTGKVYFIGQNEPVNLWNFINQALTMNGQKPVTTKIPFSLVYAIGFMLEKIYGLLKLKSEPPM